MTGAGAALDAATRGLRVALVEARDLAFGTSSRSSKLIHGGLRYLEQLEFGLVREALRERELMLTRLAPHLVKPVPFLYPLTRRWWERPYVTAGLTLYDLLGGARSVPPHRQLTKAGALRLVPALRRNAVIGGIRYFDAQVDDARFTVTLARTAAHYGAVVRTGTRVVGMIREADRIRGVRVRDEDGGTEIDVNAHSVINCTGVWTDETQALSGVRGRFRVRASKGVHIVVPRDRIIAESGLIARTANSVLFVIPWHGQWLIGTTDTDWHGPLDEPIVADLDVDYLLSEVNKILATPLTRDDIDGVYAGLRPLLAGESDETSKLSREHAVARVAPGLVAIAGGKYTTYRVMAADAVDTASADLPGRTPSSITDQVPLLGADGYHALINKTDQLAAAHGLPPYRLRMLLDRYGGLTPQLLASADSETLRPIPHASNYLLAEARYAVTHEGARTLADVLDRRTRIAIEYRDGGAGAVRAIAEVIAGPLGWDAARVEAEVDRARVD